MSRDSEMRSLAVALGRCSTAQLRDLRIRTEAMLRVDEPELAIPVSGSAPPSGGSPPPVAITPDGGADPLFAQYSTPTTSMNDLELLPESLRTFRGSESRTESECAMVRGALVEPAFNRRVKESTAVISEAAQAYGDGGELRTSGSPMTGTQSRGHETAGAVSLSQRVVRIPAKGTLPPPVTPAQVMSSARADVLPRVVIDFGDLDDVDVARAEAVKRARRETDRMHRGKR